MNPKTIIIFAVLALAGAVLFVLVRPKIGEIQALRGEFENKQSDAQTIEQRIQTTKKAIAQFDSVSGSDIGMVESALPDESDLPNLFILTHNLISSSGLIGEDIEIKEEDGGFGISVALHGSYGSFKQFLLEVEKSLRIFDVESIVFSSVGTKSPGMDILTFKVRMKTWLY